MWILRECSRIHNVACFDNRVSWVKAKFCVGSGGFGSVGAGGGRRWCAVVLFLCGG